MKQDLKLTMERRVKREERTEKKKHDTEAQKIKDKRDQINENIRKGKEERENLIKIMKDETKKISHTPFHKQKELEDIEEARQRFATHKDQLRSMKELRAPWEFDKNEILEHRKKHDEDVRLRVEDLKKHRYDKLPIFQTSFDPSKFQTKFSKLVQEWDEEREEEKEAKKERILERIEKKEAYDNYVKEMHWPKIS